MSKLYLGVDCGGTKTAFVLTDAAGAALAACEKGPTDTLSRDMGEVEAVLAAGIAEILSQAGIGADAVTRVGLGFSGFGETPEGTARLFGACERALRGIPFVAENDVVVAWAGALSMQPGIVVIAGTGSNCYGRNARGESARAGGWGAYCDEGSGQWFGANVARLFTRQADGRAPQTALYGLMREAFRLEDDLYFAHTLNTALAAHAGEMAKLYRIALAAWRAEDPCVRQLFVEGAAELALAARTVARRLGFADGEYTCSYAGGVFQGGEAILKPLRAALQGYARLVAPQQSPVMGAALMARHPDL